MDIEPGGLPAVTDDSPAGENLELDPQFGELERAAQGKPEVQYGSTIEAAVPPDWKETVSIAESLLKRTHDLRVLVHLAIARLNTDGLAGFASVAAMIHHEIEDRWPLVHPQLDPEDDNDPMVRANSLLPLRDPARVLKPLRDVNFAGHPRKRLICWRDIAVSNGTLEAEPGRDKLTDASIQAAFNDSDKGWLESNRLALERLLVHVPAIPKAFERHAGPATGPDYSALVKLLSDMSRDYNRYLASVTPDAPAEEDAAAEGADAGAPAARGSAGPARGYASISAIATLTRREEALHALDLAAGYFRSQEPSSPLPLLIERAKRLAVMGFMDILKDLAPDGLRQAELVTGPQNE